MSTSKRYFFSSAVTFATAFALYFVTVIDTITLASFTDGALVSALFVAARAGIKGVMEFFLVSQTNK